jgi:hypothetical protein
VYKQRILPLFLAVALCTTQVRAEKDAWFTRMFYIAGTVTALVWCWVGWEAKKAVNASAKQADEMLNVHRAARQYGERAEKDREIMMRRNDDIFKIGIAKMIRKKIFSRGDLEDTGVSSDFLILHDDIQSKLKQRPTL